MQHWTSGEHSSTLSPSSWGGVVAVSHHGVHPGLSLDVTPSFHLYDYFAQLCIVNMSWHMQAITGGQPQYLGIPLPFSLTTLLAIVCPDSIC